MVRQRTNTNDNHILRSSGNHTSPDWQLIAQQGSCRLPDWHWIDNLQSRRWRWLHCHWPRQLFE